MGWSRENVLWKPRWKTADPGTHAHAARAATFGGVREYTYMVELGKGASAGRALGDAAALLGAIPLLTEEMHDASIDLR